MSSNFIEKLKSQSVKDENWLKEAEWRQANEDWLDISFAIAVKILRTLRERNMTQKDLAERLGLTPQYVNKIVKGQENLTLETICKIENALDINLIRVPDHVFTATYTLSDPVNNRVGFNSSVSLPPRSSELNEPEEICCETDLLAA